MKKGLVVIVILSLALMAFACSSSNGTHIPMLNEGSANEAGEAAAGYASEANQGSMILATPTVEELLNTLLEEEDVTDSTKTSIEYILDLLPELEGWLSEIPDETWQAIDEIMGNVGELQTVTDTINFLQDAVDSGNYSGHEYLPEALEFGIDLLEDGEDTIYNPEWDTYADEPFLSFSFNASQMMKEALGGGLSGAVGAALTEAAFAQYAIGIGGCVGAVDSLIADMISQLPGCW